MVMGWLVEGTQLSPLIAGLSETNSRALPLGDGVRPTSCQLGGQAPERARGW